MSPVAAALLEAYPGSFDQAAAEEWVTARRQLLRERIARSPDQRLAVSSGCAATGVKAHVAQMVDDATLALSRLEGGLATHCEVCDDVLDLDRLASAPTAVRCVGCVRAYELDTRWCR